MKPKDSITLENKNISSLATREGAAFLKVVHWFLDYPDKEVSLNDLASITGIAKATANTVVSSLVKQEFLKREILGKLWRISCNQKHPYNVGIKIPYHLGLLYFSGIIQETLKKVPGARSIILFGSYRKGDDTQESDIDIAVEVLENVPLKIIPFTALKKIGYRKDIQVNLHIFSRKNIDLNLFTNIANGIVLYGLLEVKP